MSARLEDGEKTIAASDDEDEEAAEEDAKPVLGHDAC